MDSNPYDPLTRIDSFKWRNETANEGLRVLSDENGREDPTIDHSKVAITTLTRSC